MFASWAEAASNPWFSLTRDVAAGVLGEPTPPMPRAPGPLAFAETGYVLDILAKAGFSDGSVRREEVGLFHPGGLEAVTHLATVVGPAARVVQEFDGGPQDIEEIARRIADAFRQYVVDGGIRIPATINIFTAGKA